IDRILAAPTDDAPRLIYAEWLEEQGHPGATYLRAEVSLSHKAGVEAGQFRRVLLDCIPELPANWRNRFEQPDLLLAPPVPFATGWYSATAASPGPYRGIANLDPDRLSPDLPWLSGEGVKQRVDQGEHEREELTALAEVQRRAAHLGLILPPGFESF